MIFRHPSRIRSEEADMSTSSNTQTSVFNEASASTAKEFCHIIQAAGTRA